MMMLTAAAAGGVLAGAAAAGLAATTRGFAERPESRWLTTPVLAGLGVACGVLMGLRVDAWAELPAFVVVAVASALLSGTDFAELRIPNRLLGPAYVALLVCLLGATLLLGDWGRLGRALLGGLALMVAYFAIAWVRPQDFGLGDVKLGVLVGTFLGWFGWWHVLVGGVGAFFVYAALVLVLLAARRVGRTSELPMGPAIIVSMVAASFFTPAVMGWLTSLAR